MVDDLKTTRLARRSIQLLEKAIFNEFGLQVHMGAELEYRLLDKDGKGKGFNLPLMTDAKWSKTREYFYAGDDGSRFRNSRLLKDSSFIRAHYKEDNAGKHEVVFSHEPEKNHGCAFLADAIAKTKHIISREAPRYCEEDVQANFKAYRRGVTAGLHLNVSLWRNGKNNLNYLYTTSHFTDVYCGDWISAAMLPALRDAMLLMAPKPESLRRFGVHDGVPESLDVRPDDIMKSGAVINRYNRYNETMESSMRIENRIPGADADPHLAIVATLYAVYSALCMMRDDMTHPLLQGMRYEARASLGKISKDFGEVRNQFLEATDFANILNRLSGEEKLGDALKEAVLAQTAELGKYSNRRTARSSFGQSR